MSYIPEKLPPLICILEAPEGLLMLPFTITTYGTVKLMALFSKMNTIKMEMAAKYMVSHSGLQ